MKERTLNLIRDRGKNLMENWNSEFSNRSEFWAKGPSWFFYKEIMKKHKEKPIQELLDDRYFLICIYGALASWGLDRMGKRGPKMRDFEDFQREIIKNKDKIINLSKLNIQKDAKKLKKDLLGLFESIKISENQNKTKIVANSKTMHFLLPLQTPIVDREYIIRYFSSEDIKKYPRLDPRYEVTFFSEIIDIYFRLIRKENIVDEDPLRIIDKTIVNYVRKKLERKA